MDERVKCFVRPVALLGQMDDLIHFSAGARGAPSAVLELPIAEK
jgi:hypothetical protein